MNTITRRLRANAPEWAPQVRDVSTANVARRNLVNKLKKLFRTRRNNKVLIPRSKNPVYDMSAISNNAFNRAMAKINLNMNYNTIQGNLKKMNINRRWNEPAENITTPISGIVQNIRKNTYANINAANWNTLSNNIRAETAKGRRANRKNRKSRKVNRP
jgi:hypothetical protein